MALTQEQKAEFRRAIARNDGKAIDRLVELWCRESAIPKPAKKSKRRKGA